jgi:hypothetical protein
VPDLDQLDGARLELGITEIPGEKMILDSPLLNCVVKQCADRAERYRGIFEHVDGWSANIVRGDWGIDA